MTSLEHPRKRLHAVLGTSNPPAKRTRAEWPHSSSPFTDRDSISNASSIHQIPSGVPRAFNQPPAPTHFPGDAFLRSTDQSQQTSQYYPLPNAWDQTVLAQDISSSVGGVDRLPPSELFLARSNMYDGSSSISCLAADCFGFNRTTREWADALASLAPTGPGSTNQVSPSRWLIPVHMIHADPLIDENPYLVEKSESEPHVFQDSRIPACSPGSYYLPAYSDNPPQYDQGLVTLELTSQFGADDGVVSPPVRQVNSGLMSVELRQPLANVSHMEYPMDLAYQAGSAWSGGNQNARTDPVEDLWNDGLVQSNDQQPETGAADQPVRHGEGGPLKRRAFQDLQQRLETAQTRVYKACVRCKMQKVRCVLDPQNPTGVCLTCRKVSNVRVPGLGCLRIKVTEIRLSKPGQVPELQWTQRWPDLKLKDISEWASPERRWIKTTEGFTALPLELEVRRFIPRKGDILERHWWTRDRVKKSVLVPAFAIADVGAARKAYENYINNYGSEFIMGCLTGKDKLLTKTYSAAFEAASNPNTSEEEATLLKMVLRLWIAIRITTRSIRICGEDTLDMPRDILDETSPLHGKIPVPPVLGTQIELILIENIQKPLRKEVLHQLQKLILANKLNTWYTLYLCTFILLHNCSMVTKYDTGYAKKYIPDRKYARPDIVEECHGGANTLLAYWHYRNKGYKPFTTEITAADFHAMSELKPHQTKFIKETSDYVQSNATTWKSLVEKQAYENDFYFVSQLYEHDWRPRTSIIV